MATFKLNLDGIESVNGKATPDGVNVMDREGEILETFEKEVKNADYSAKEELINGLKTDPLKLN